jgi:putative selenium metabolism protein SsnA
MTGIAEPTSALTGGTVVVALDPPEVAPADILLAGDRVVAVGPGAAGSAPPGASRRDCSGTLILPGNVCAHHHLYSALARGMPFGLAGPTNFVEILQRVWWRLDRALDEESIRASALRGGLDALHAGTTTIVDHHASPNAIDGSLDIIADALAEVGVRSVLCYEVTDRDGPERAAAGIDENLRFMRGLVRAPRALARGMMGAHASFTLSDDTLAGCADGALASGTGVHIHVAEDGADQRDAIARGSRRVTDRLAAAGIITDRALLAHCVHLDATEIGLVDASGATVVVNPRSNMNNGVGHSPFTPRPGRVGRVALGTDGIGGDLFAESHAGFFRARETDLATDSSWPLAALAEGARLAGGAYGEPLLGTLTVGAPADLTVLDYPGPTPVGADNLAGHWVFGLSAMQVRDVFVAGELVIADGRSTRVDELKVAAESRAQTERLWARLERVPAHDFEPLGKERR